MAFQSLKNIPWSIFEVSDVHYMVKHKMERGYSVMIAEGSSLFYEDLNAQDVMIRCKQLNPKFEITEENLMDTLNVILSNFKGADTLDVKLEESELSVKTKSSVAGMILHWQFKLQRQPPSITYDELILPLLGIIQKLITEKTLLIEIIKKKDVEISDYKCNGSKVSLPVLETPEFKEEDFEASQNQPEVLTQNFNKKCLLEVYGSNLFTLMRSTSLAALEAKTGLDHSGEADAAVKKEEKPLEQQKEEEYFPHVPNKDQLKRRKCV